MERLTKHWGNNYVATKLNYDFLLGEPIEDKDTDAFFEIIKKLAHYEDLEEQGLLMRLPCKSGDMIYKVCEGKVYKNVVSRIEVFGSKNYLVFFDYGEDELCVMSADYNVLWFTSEAEAEKALEEMEK